MDGVFRTFQYVIKYKKEKSNIVADALSRRHELFSKLGAQILGFEPISELYSQDSELSTIFSSCHSKSQGGYYVSKGFSFKEGKLCIPQGSHGKVLVKEIREGGFMGHFEVDKTLNMLKERFFWSHMRRDV